MARWGREEQLIFLPQTVQSGAMKARADFASHPFLCDRFTIGITVSLGVSPLVKGLSGDEFIRRENVALYRAKSSGRNRTVADKNDGAGDK